MDMAAKYRRKLYALDQFADASVSDGNPAEVNGWVFHTKICLCDVRLGEACLRSRVVVDR